MAEFNIVEYLSDGIEDLMKDVIRASLKNPAESLFMARFALASSRASKKRLRLEKEEGELVPAFLIASITSSCNLHCAGCYARANQSCTDEEPEEQLSAQDWRKIFREAEDLGVSFILLAGGEPLLRYDVIEEAAKFDSILFPVFTNGTMIGEKYLELFKKNRNLLPVLSIEGREEKTDDRRGEGVYTLVLKGMEKLNEAGILFGTSVTVTTENMDEVYSDAFIDRLDERGAKIVFFIEFVPVTEESRHLAPGDAERAVMEERLNALRERRKDIVFVSFPGDEKGSGGCVAAGRGFFHINSHGGAEPCPFSPYSDINVKKTSLKEALHSKLFTYLRDSGALFDDHVGGCTLFAKREEIEDYIRAEKEAL